jgi:hypothetical protein
VELGMHLVARGTVDGDALRFHVGREFSVEEGTGTGTDLPESGQQ